MTMFVIAYILGTYIHSSLKDWLFGGILSYTGFPIWKILNVPHMIFEKSIINASYQLKICLKTSICVCVLYTHI